MHRTALSLALCAALLACSAMAQPTTPVNSPSDNNSTQYITGDLTVTAFEDSNCSAESQIFNMPVTGPMCQVIDDTTYLIDCFLNQPSTVQQCSNSTCALCFDSTPTDTCYAWNNSLASGLKFTCTPRSPSDGPGANPAETPLASPESTPLGGPSSNPAPNSPETVPTVVSAPGVVPQVAPEPTPSSATSTTFSAYLAIVIIAIALL